MMLLSPPALITWVVIPSLFAFIVALMARRSCPNDRAEKQTLLVMLMPFGLGAAMVGLAGKMPVAPIMLDDSEFSAASLFSDAITSSTQLPHNGAMSGLAILGLGYLAVTAWRLFVWFRGLVDLYRLGRDPAAQIFDAGVLISRRTKTPLIHPSGRVILPEGFIETFSKTETQMVLAHEQAHHQRGDQVYFIVLALIDALFWFHPAIRWQTLRCRLAAELACDDAACNAFPSQRASYGKLILSALRSLNGAENICAPTAFTSRSKGEIRMRIQNITHSPSDAAKGQWWKSIVALVVVPLAAAQWALAQDSVQADFTVPPIEDGKVTSRFGPRDDPWASGKKVLHRGLDIAAPLGTVVRAPAAGIVSAVSPDTGAYGNLLEITHADQIVTRYTQLHTIEVDIGDRVRPGETVATVGSSGRSTGPHLHIELFVEGQQVDPETRIALPTKEWGGARRLH